MVSRRIYSTCITAAAMMAAAAATFIYVLTAPTALIVA